MNTIKINYGDINKIGKYEPTHYFEQFIFNEFKLIVKQVDYKVIYKIKINGKVNEVLYRVIKNNSYMDCKFSFTEKEDGFEFIENPNGDYVNKIVETMLNTKGNILTDEEIANYVVNYFMYEVEFIRIVKQYIMNESYKRITIQKESNRKNIDSIESKSKKTAARRTQTEIYLLDEIVQYVSSGNRRNNITCECWTVRGHFRHYRNGNVIWISSYEKGKARNTNHIYNGNVYVV